jgi:glycosyltransferase involved in cell wall biosynthesis
MKELILVTAGFPFGMGETFLETEVKYLAKGFDNVKIVAINPSNQTRRSLPENCQATALEINVGGKEKLKALRYLFTKLFWREVKVIRSVYKKKLTKGMINTMLISLYRASRITAETQTLLDKNEQTFYSYWCDDAALALGLLKEKHPKVSAVCRAHGWDVYFEVHELNYLPFRHFIANQLDAIYPISHKGKEYITEQWKVSNPEKVEVARLGVTAQKKVIPSGTFTMVSCSNLIPLKRVELIIEGLSNITEHPFHWTHFGDGPEKERLVQLASAKLGSNINWEFKGRIPNTQVLQWYAENNPFLFMNVSSSEGIPVSIMEALSFGIPCIATNVGGNSEIVNEQNGKLLAENPTPQEISNAICAFLEPSVFKLKSEGAFLTWKEQYNGEKNYTAFVKQLINLH